MCAGSVAQGNVLRVIPDSIYSLVTAKEDGTPVMELLGHDHDLLQPEDVAGAHDRIQRPEPGAVAIHSVRRDACLQQAFFHVRGFVIALGVVVATYQKMDVWFFLAKSCLRTIINGIGQRVSWR